jgi:ATP-dependent helicase/DNAse subunit B
MLKYIVDTVKKDKYKALWLSHSSISDYLKCPRLYYLHTIYKDLRTGHKISIINPALTLGQTVHTVIESLANLSLEERFKISPLLKFEEAWQKVSGGKGGFENYDEEALYKEKGVKMINDIINNPGPIAKKAIRIRSENNLPYFWFSEDENIILCGKIDWLEYLPQNDSVHIIDFKTGRIEEDENSLQLPIYLLLANNLQKRKVAKVSYWYLNSDKGMITQKLPNEKESVEKISKIAARIALARKLNHFKCQVDGCKYCYPYERILKNEGIWVGVSEYQQDIYVLKKPQPKSG